MMLNSGLLDKKVKITAMVITNENTKTEWIIQRSIFQAFWWNWINDENYHQQFLPNRHNHKPKNNTNVSIEIGKNWRKNEYHCNSENQHKQS